MEQWQILKTALIEKNYKLWQMQFSYDAPEGFHAWFWRDDKRVEVATHNKDIQKDIVSSGLC
jgi:acetyl-CoA carboxylase alpha subunit